MIQKVSTCYEHLFETLKHPFSLFQEVKGMNSAHESYYRNTKIKRASQVVIAVMHNLLDESQDQRNAE